MSHFNLLAIIIAFWGFICRGSSKLDSGTAAAILVLPPALLGGIVLYSNFKIDDQVYGSLISIFSIFGAFLFASQLSVFTIFRILFESSRAKERRDEGDPISSQVAVAENQNRRQRLTLGFKDINASISYLVALSVLVLGVLYVAVVLKFENRVASAVIAALSLHFLLVLMVVIRMCHDVFDAGYVEQ